MASDAPPPLSPLPSPPSSEGHPSPLTSNSDSIGPPLSDLQSLSDWNPSDHSDLESEVADDDGESDYDMINSWRGSHSSSSSRRGNLLAPPSDAGSTGTNRSAVDALRLSYPDPMASMSDESTATLLASTLSLTDDSGAFSIVDAPETTSEPPPAPVSRLSALDGTDRSENVKTWLHSTGSSTKIESIGDLKEKKEENDKSVVEDVANLRDDPVVKDLLVELESDAGTSEGVETSPLIEEPLADSLISDPSLPLSGGEGIKKTLEELCVNRTQRPRVISTLGLVLAGAVALASTLYARPGSQPISSIPAVSTVLPSVIPPRSAIELASSTSVMSNLPSATPVASCSMSNPAACALALVDASTGIATLNNPFNGKMQQVVQLGKKASEAPRPPPRMNMKKTKGKRHAKMSKNLKRCGGMVKRAKTLKKLDISKEATEPLDATEVTFREALASIVAASRGASQKARSKLRKAAARSHSLRRQSHSHLHQLRQSSKLYLDSLRTTHLPHVRHLSKHHLESLKEWRREGRQYALSLKRSASDVYHALAKHGRPVGALAEKELWRPWKRHCLRASHNLRRIKRKEFKRVGARWIAVGCDHVSAKHVKACRRAAEVRKSWPEQSLRW